MLEDLQKRFPSITFLVESSEIEAYRSDWTNTWTGNPCGVALPSSTIEISEILEFCHQNSIAVVPAGGRSGLSGAAVALNGELILSLEKINFIDDVDEAAKTVSVGAGVITQNLHEQVSKHGLYWPIQFAATGSSQIGGNIATNAGGIHVIKYGSTRNWVLGLTVVLMDGTVLKLNGKLEKNNTGYDFRHLFIGSEGTLGIVTEATLKLTKTPTDVTTCFFALASMDDILTLLGHCNKHKDIDICAFEMFTKPCLDLVTNKLSLKCPISNEAAYYTIVETTENDALMELLEEMMENEVIVDGTIAQSSKDASTIWALRENITEAISQEGYVHKNDIAVAISDLPRFVNHITSAYQNSYPEFQVYIFGHIGDGNLHINAVAPKSMNKKDFFAKCQQTDQKIFSILQDFSGSISAEHGVGIKKRDYLHFTRSPKEIELMKNIKQVFDPKNLLNPGKIF